MATSLANIAFTVSQPVYSTNYPTEFLVYNGSYCSGQNGGQCCYWVAPAGTSWVTFEIWGGGGGGGGSCCCQSGSGGGAGAYSVKSVCTGTTGGLAGQGYTICAGSTTFATPYCTGCPGYVSYVNGYGLSNFCAQGGCQSVSTCWQYFSCYTGCNVICCMSSACGGDITMPGYSGGELQTQFCGAKAQGFAAVAPATVSGPWTGPHGCQWGGCTSWGTGPYFPGGGGRPGIGSANNCCCGEYGGGGLVSITYG